MNVTNEVVDILQRRIKELAESSAPDQLAYLAKSFELIVDKKVISKITQMTAIKEIIDILQKRLKDLAVTSTPDQLAYLAKTLESIVDKSVVSEITQISDGKLKELLNKTNSHLNDLNNNKANAIAVITESEKGSLKKMNDQELKSLSLFDTRKDANIAAIDDSGKEHLQALRELVNTFEAISDPEILLKILNQTDLETWLSNTGNQKKFSKMLSNASAVFNITDNSSALEKLVNSPLGLQELLKSSVALNIIANTVAINTLVKLTEVTPSTIKIIVASPLAMNIIIFSFIAMSRVAASSIAMNIIVDSSIAMNAIVSSSTAISAIASSGEALRIIIKSESACKIIESNIQSYRSTVINTLNTSSSLFRKQSGVTVGNGATTQTNGTGSSTIYIPTFCYDDNDTDFNINSVLSGNSFSYIARHNGETPIGSGITLRGVQVSGVGGSVGNVIFDIYTAI
ncbi:hypothetical protein [Wolbachia endosymbiont of Chironomus riparius]|uniref:hypothetical protein n=1 Tax=Wolbachia endosymbiont of Chironomus riparius TaxID=2883238 RepID=UPI00209CF3B2|nr:hypothetical protein [Wolbachia endosymbiont of Chironomus riparius]